MAKRLLLVLILVVAGCGITPTPTPTPTFGVWPGPSVTPTSVRSLAMAVGAVAVNCGGSTYLASSGINYIGDYYGAGGWTISGGSTYSNERPVEGTGDSPLYQSERYGMLNYTFALPNGAYLVTVKMAEIYPYTTAGKRVFNITYQGQTVAAGVDLVSLVGPFVAYDVTAPANVIDGSLVVGFQKIAGDAKCGAILITPLSTATPTPTAVMTPTPYVTPTPDPIMTRIEALEKQADDLDLMIQGVEQELKDYLDSHP
jgi:hypothetical protein